MAARHRRAIIAHRHSLPRVDWHRSSGNCDAWNRMLPRENSIPADNVYHDVDNINHRIKNNNVQRNAPQTAIAATLKAIKNSAKLMLPTHLHHTNKKTKKEQELYLYATTLALGGGKTGIRTLDTVTCITVFETAPFGHSGIFPLLFRNCECKVNNLFAKKQ